MRALFAALLVALPALAAAQSARSDPGANPSLPPIGFPLPQIGLPLTSLAPPRVDKPVSRGDRRSPPNQRPRRGDDRGRHSRPTVVYVVPAYGWNHAPGVPTGSPVVAAADEPSEPPEPSAPTGILSLDVQGLGSAQLHVDGFYIGTTDDVGGQLTLEAGPHTVEIRAPGYETVTVKVKIETGRAITYRDTLRPLAAIAEPPARAVEDAPAQRKPFYLIPGCYVGDVPPKDAGLPATCDQSQAKIIPR